MCTCTLSGADAQTHGQIGVSVSSRNRGCGRNLRTEVMNDRPTGTRPLKGKVGKDLDSQMIEGR